MRLPRLLPAAFALATAPLAFAQARSPQLTALLAQMDTASKSFKNAQADVTYDNYTRVIHAHDVETGSIYIERTGAGEEMGALFYDLGSDGKPAKSPSKIVSYQNAILQLDTTGTNQVDVFKAGDNQAKYESFLTLGFGGSGQALDKNWIITDQGPETVEGVKTEKLDLVSKEASVKSTFTHVTIWIDPVRDISLKQIFYAPNNDNRTATYTNIRLNAKIDKSHYAISKSAKRIQH
jgi:hypothetical protein